jgi:Fuc2NAc and GlcNAc transferase
MNPSEGLIVGGTLVASLIATGMMRRYAWRKGLLDVPNSRSSHAFPTPRGGGLAIVLAFLAAVGVLGLAGRLNIGVLAALMLGGGAMAAIGFIDDQRPLSAGVRLVVHLAAASCAVTLVGGVPDSSLKILGMHGAWIGVLIAVPAVIWASNLFNFMDGIDGIAGSEAVFMTCAGAWLNAWHRGDVGLTASLLSLSAASLGFLIWNWPPAKIFMGDVGSGFLGFVVATLGLACAQAGALPIGVWAILGGTFLVDATVTLLRRVARGDRWFEAHRIHAYQHLTRRWGAHGQVTKVVMLVNLFWLLPWAWVAANDSSIAPLCIVGALGPLIGLAIVAGAGSREK